MHFAVYLHATFCENAWGGMQIAQYSHATFCENAWGGMQIAQYSHATFHKNAWGGMQIAQYSHATFHKNAWGGMHVCVAFSLLYHFLTKTAASAVFCFKSQEYIHFREVRILSGAFLMS